METASMEWENKTLINELSQGMELAKQLGAHLSSSTSSSDSRQLLMQRLISSFEKSLLILKWRGSVGQAQQAAVPSATGMPESSISVDQSPRSEDFERGFKDHQEDHHHHHIDVSKKRKLQPTWTEQVKICSENGIEGSNDDGYCWRKYGQKDILGAKYPRSYYRCTYRNVQNCWATKQVQRSDEDPTIFEITYRGKHTCNQVLNYSVPRPKSPGKQEIKHHHHQKQQPNELLMNFRASLRVDTENIENNEDMAYPFSFPSTIGCAKSQSQMFPISSIVNDNLLGSSSPSFLSPAASESNYFPASPCQMNGFGGLYSLQHSESDLPEIISANASATNSPILDLDFSMDPVEFNPYLPFDTSGYFT